MSIKDPDNQQAPQQQPTPAMRAGVEPPPVRPQTRQAPTGRPGNDSGVNLLPSMLRKSPVGLSGFGEAVKKLTNTIKDILAADGGDESDIKVLILDSQQRGTSLSCVVITAGALRGTQSYVAAHTLVVEASGGRLPKLQYNIANQQCEITATAGDVFNQAMWEKVKQLVSEHYPTGSEIRHASGTTIPLEMDLGDVDRVRKVLFYAIQAVYTHIEDMTNQPVPTFSVSAFTRQDRVSAKVDFTPQAIETTTGLPIRSDVAVILNASNTAVNQADLSPSLGKDFSRIDGYIDLVYQQPPRPGFGQPMITQHYHPRFVMTNFAPLLEGVNLELLLLALSSSTLLSRNSNYAWGGVFRPKYGPDINLRNIGAIGLEIPQLVGSPDGKGDIINTQASTFTMENLYQLLVTAIHPNLIYSFDVEENGSLTFIHSIFSAAASGDAGANQMIIEAANRLTDNHFSRYFQNGPVAVEDNNRVHLGYYTNTKGERRDIREIDTLAVLNMIGKQDPTIPVKWANTFDRVDLPMEQRLDERERILTSLIGAGSMRITGYGRRITFNPAFISALSDALINAGLVIQPGNQSYLFGDQVIRGNDQIGQWAFSGQAANNLFNYSSPQVSGRGMINPLSTWYRQ